MRWAHTRTRRRSARGAALTALALGLACGSIGLATTAAPAASPGASIDATASPRELTIGGAVAVAGRLVESGVAVAGAPLALQVESYPFRGFQTIARQASAEDGSFAFAALHPDRNTKLRVVLESAPASTSAELAVTVDPQVATNARLLGPGRTLLSIRLRHTVHAGSAAASASWFVAGRGTRVFRLAGVTPTRELEPGLSYASLTIDPPSRHFAYRVCLNPGWEHAMGTHGSHGRCPTHDYALQRDVR